MAREKFAKKVGVSLAIMLAINSMASISVQATTEITNEVVNTLSEKKLTINPLPQSMEILNGQVELTETINIIGADQADLYAVELLKSILTNMDITVNEIPVEGATTIYIGEVNDNIVEMEDAITELAVDTSTVTKSEGYILAAKDDEAGDKIIIRGNDESGTFYGVQTLKQIIENDNDKNIEEVVIKDEPNIELRAVVEGFYGTPWTQEERLDQLKMYGENKMNAYIYAPKSDPYHRDLWREPYPESELDRMQELIYTANENKVDFIFAISPGIDIKFDGEEGEADFQALLNKCETLYEMGVRRFAILWDDIENSQGDKHAEILNRFNEEFVKVKDGVKSLITVPKEYWETSMFDLDGVTIQKYTKDFAETLDEDIEVMWTGHHVIPSHGVTMEDVDVVTNIYGKKMMLWWNYPVNDYKEDKLGLGPMYGFDNNLDEKMSGFIINPMRFAEASKISTLTGADYAWNTKAYDYERSWDNALKVVGGEAKEELKYVADHSTRLDTGRPDSPELDSFIETMWEKWDNGEDVSSELATLKSEFEKMISTPDSLREKLDNEELLSQMEKQLVKFEKYGEVGLGIVSMLESIQNDDMVGFWNKKYEGMKALAELDSLEGIIAEKVVDPFIRKSHDIGSKYFNDKTTILEDEIFTKKYNYTPIMNIEGPTTDKWFLKDIYLPEYIVDDRNDSGFVSGETVKAGEYMGFDLGQVETIKDVFLAMGRTCYDEDIVTTGVLEYSVDGENWTELKVNDGQYDLLAECDIEARYVRYRITEDSDKKLYIRDFKVNTGKTLENVIGNIKSETAIAKKSVEGTEEVTLVENIGEVSLKAGDTIGLALNDVKHIVAVTANGNMNESDFVIESSIDNAQWEKVAEGTSFRVDDPVVGKYFRIKAINDTKVNIENIKVYTEGFDIAEVTTNRRISTNDLIHPRYAADNDISSQFVCSDDIFEGEFVQLDYGKVKHVRDIRIVQGPGADILSGDVEYSVDGENWTKVGVITGPETLIKDLDINVRYVRVISDRNEEFPWTRVRMIAVNTTEKEYKTSATASGTYVDRTENIRDNDLNTAYIPTRDIVAGDTLTYRIFDGKLTSKVTVVQGADNISGAKVIAETINGETIELGILDEALKELHLENPRNIVAVKLVWESDAGRPEIFEIKPTFVSLDSIMEKINSAIATAEEALKSEKVTEERIALEESLANIKEKLASDMATEDEKVLAYEDLIEKTKAFIDSVETPEVPEIPEIPEVPESPEVPETPEVPEIPETPVRPETSKPETSEKPNKPTENLPQTGAVVGTGVIAAIGGLLTAAGVAIFKRKKD
ncbi:beta-N-acetylglucosaminidase domain-containing protein [Clostridium celatum]|nr:beta-N-acetylglucosaminidase domain-containing protein [Clostridium celatum]MCE9653710.1 beta-N-acetylglucosaminidase domain-containing protein [Clostridium celatum]